MMNLGHRTVSPLISVWETHSSTALECWLAALSNGLHLDARRSLSGRSGHARSCGFDASVADDPKRSWCALFLLRCTAPDLLYAAATHAPRAAIRLCRCREVRGIPAASWAFLQGQGLRGLAARRTAGWRAARAATGSHQGWTARPRLRGRPQHYLRGSMGRGKGGPISRRGGG